MNVERWQTVNERFRRDDIAGAIHWLESLLAKEPHDRFKGLIGTQFANPPTSVAAAINEFVRGCDKKCEVRAVYLEMNGFDINPDRWYFDFFGYSKYDRSEDELYWIGGWESDRWPDVTLVG